MSPSADTADRRLLLVHAHPDDESINNGATMAKYAAEGAHVTLVTCTLGEEGEVLVPDLVHLAADADDTLGQHRVTELEAAMAELGVTDHRFLGGAGHFRDSGMEWGESGAAQPRSTVREDTFWRADLNVAADLLVEILREVRPHVLVTYDQFGNYGHPDHIQAHRVAMYAAQLAAVPSYKLELGEPWDIPKIYWVTMSLSRVLADVAELEQRGRKSPFGEMSEGMMRALFSDDDAVAAQIDGIEFAAAKIAALRAHATQIPADDAFFSLADDLGEHVWGLEEYRLAKGRQGPVDERGWETDLFAGLGL